MCMDSARRFGNTSVSCKASRDAFLIFSVCSMDPGVQASGGPKCAGEANSQPRSNVCMCDLKVRRR